MNWRTLFERVIANIIGGAVIYFLYRIFGRL